MNERKKILLGTIVELYIDTVSPAGSTSLVRVTDLGISAPTIRNEMRALEEEGYLSHPHTSAGRVPTEKGYRYYVDNIMESHAIEDALKVKLDDCGKEEFPVKTLAKECAEYVRNAVIAIDGREKVYYTGLSYLFAQPEFRDIARTVQISAIFDHVDEQVDLLFEHLGETPTALIGKENPLGPSSTFVGFRKNNTIFGFLGPLRMPYKDSFALLTYLSQ